MLFFPPVPVPVPDPVPDPVPPTTKLPTLKGDSYHYRIIVSCLKKQPTTGLAGQGLIHLMIADQKQHVRVYQHNSSRSE